MSATTVAPTCIRLILSHTSDAFYLEIPVAVVTSLCLRPIKYLRFLGWCILGILGTVTHARNGLALADDSLLQDQGIYFYVYGLPVGQDASNYAVDLEIVKTRSLVSSDHSSTRDSEFKEMVVQRDASCIFTNAPAEVCEGIHIIPFHKGDEWFRLILANRPHDGEDVSTLTSVDDIRNAMLLAYEQHKLFDKRKLVVLKTPNLVLDMEDVPPRHERTLSDDIKYPNTERYTLQWLSGSEVVQRRTPNNSDATFRIYNRKPKPSPLLLHYNYGAAAVKWWGHGAAHLAKSNRPNIPRPSVSMPAPMGPTRTTHNRQLTTDKLTRARNPPSSNVGGTGGTDPNEDVMDPDEVVLSFWVNTPAAYERRKRAAAEHASRMEQWQRGGLFV